MVRQNTRILNIQRALLEVWHTSLNNEVDVDLHKVLTYVDRLRIRYPTNDTMPNCSPIVGKYFE